MTNKTPDDEDTTNDTGLGTEGECLSFIIKLKPHEAPCHWCGINISHQCAGPPAALAACKPWIVAAFVEGQYAAEGRFDAVEDVPKHIAGCAQCTAWYRGLVTARNARSGLSGAKFVKVRQQPDDRWSEGLLPLEGATSEIPVALRGCVGALVSVGGQTAQVSLSYS